MSCMRARRQGEDPDYAWVVTVLMFYVRLVCGALGAVLSVCWLLQARRPVQRSWHGSAAALRCSPGDAAGRPSVCAKVQSSVHS